MWDTSYKYCMLEYSRNEKNQGGPRYTSQNRTTHLHSAIQVVSHSHTSQAILVVVSKEIVVQESELSPRRTKRNRPASGHDVW